MTNLVHKAAILTGGLSPVRMNLTRDVTGRVPTGHADTPEHAFFGKRLGARVQIP